jgi:uncharacterized protein (DUF302 family)
VKFLHYSLMLLGSVLSVSATDNGLVNVPSKYSVPETLDRLESVVKTRGLTVFARIDFSGDAEKVGLKMNPSQLLIFGNPKAGTPLMIASPSVAIDLPLKALAWEDSNGKVWLSYNKPQYLKERHGLPEALIKNISAIGSLVEKATE